MSITIYNYTVNTEVYTRDKYLLSITIAIIYTIDNNSKFNYNGNHNQILFEPVIKFVIKEEFLKHKKDGIYDRFCNEHINNEIDKSIRTRLKNSEFFISDILITDIKEKILVN